MHSFPHGLSTDMHSPEHFQKFGEHSFGQSFVQKPVVASLFHPYLVLLILHLHIVRLKKCDRGKNFSKPNFNVVF